jgi:isocitrate/isopropylmalate dehydrogenase
MSVVILDIKNDEKGKYLLDFLKQVDFLEIREGTEVTTIRQEEGNESTLDEVLLNAPVLSEEEIQNIENIGKEFNNWKISEF